MLDDYFPPFAEEDIREHGFQKDSLSNLYSLAVTNVLASHNGCVNTIKWDKSGRFILSGGDDRCVAITDAFSNTSDNVVFRKELKAMSNIFIAKFGPDSCDDLIYAGFRCGCVMRVSINGGTSLSDGQLFFSHKMPVYDILMPQDQQHCLITLSHDHTVRLWDDRLPHCIGRDMHLCGRTCFFNTINASSSAHSKLPQVTPTLLFDFPVTAGDVHPLDGSRAVALASADGFVRLFDLRRLFSSSTSSEKSVPQPYQIVRPLGLGTQSNFSNEIRLDYGPLFITSVCFEPPQTHLNLSLLHASRQRRFKAQYPGRQMLVSHMYSPVFLFDLNKLEKRIEEFSHPTEQTSSSTTTQGASGSEAQTGGATHSSSSVESAEADESRAASVIFAMLLAGAVERRRAMSLIRRASMTNSSNTESAGNSSGAEESTGDTTNTSPGNRVINDTGVTKENQIASDEMIARVLTSCPRALQVASYAGQRSYRTVIKDACFWGDNCVMSGSECGHVLMWDRTTTKPVNSIKADNSVVNRLQPHPFLPYLAVSGVDHSIKLLQPTPLPLDETEEEFADRIEKRKNGAAELMGLNLTKTQQVVESSVSLRQQLASFRIGRMARLFLLQLAERRTREGSTTEELGDDDSDDNNDDDDSSHDNDDEPD